jgi:hypothetical protein
MHQNIYESLRAIFDKEPPDYLYHYTKGDKGRVAQGDCSPRAPTDPDWRISRIRLVIS